MNCSTPSYQPHKANVMRTQTDEKSDESVSKNTKSYDLKSFSRVERAKRFELQASKRSCDSRVKCHLQLLSILIQSQQCV